MSAPNRMRAPSLPALLLVVAVPAWAQPIPDAGRLLEETRPAPALPERESPRIEMEEQHPSPPADGPRIHLSRLRITGATRFTEAELHALVADDEGKELSLGELDRLAARLTRHYRARGYLLARAYLPAQEVKDGIVEIAVLEGFLGQVAINNTSGLGGQALAPLDNLRPGEVAEGAALESNLLLLSDVPGVEVSSTLKPGATLGATDLLVDVAPGRRLTGSVELDNFGDRYSGRNRLGASIQFNNPIGWGDQASLRVVASDKGMRYLRAGYQLPINRWGTRFGMAASTMKYELDKQLVPLDASGDSRVGSLYLQHPIIRSRRFNLYGQLQFDRLRLEDRVESTATVVDRTLNNWSAGLSGDFQDGLGAGAVNAFSLVYTSGKVRLDPTTAGLDAATAQSAGRFEKWNLSLLRLQALTDAASLYLSVNAQGAGKNLDSAEKLSLGGANGVRAYPQGEAPGDEIYLATLEARYRLGLGWPGLWQVEAFVDHGEARINRRPWMSGDNHRQLTGAGIGFQVFQAQSWVMKASLAWRVGSERATSDNDRSPRGWVQLVKYF